MLSLNKVLIVDDEEVVRNLCRMVLLAEGFSVQTASEGSTALKALADDRYDLLLLDLSLPDMDGLTVLEQVTRQYTQVSPIMMTGYATLEAAVQAQDLGAEGFLVKPFDDEKLIRVVNQVIERRTLRQDYARLQAHLPLMALSQRLITEQNLELLAEAFLEVIQKETHADQATLWLLPLPPSFPVGERSWRRTEPIRLAHIGQPLALSRVAPTAGTWFALDEHENMTPDINQAKVLHLLLQTEARQVGLLSLAYSSQGRFFTSKDLDFLTVVGNYLAIGLENRYLYETMNQARQEWETIFNTLNDGLLVHQANDGAITRANQTMATWLNTPIEALLHRFAAEILIGQQGCILCQLAPPGSSTKGAQKQETGQIWYSAEFDSPSWAPEKSFRVRTFPLYQRSSTADQKKEMVEIIHILEDITQTKKMQSQLLQAEKLSALGRLLASLAHEINNPLQALRGGLRLLARPNLNDEKRQSYVAPLVKEVERLIDTTSQTLDFARPSRFGKQTTHLNQLLEETLVLVSKQLQRHKIDTTLELAPNLPTIQAVPDQIKQVFLNLILNAIDAMPEGGRLSVTSNCTPDHNFAVATLTDQGWGMSPEVLNKIYEPFFSTKEVGTGLGLSISYSIVQAHGGYIEVESQPGVGSRFAVYLPVGREGDDGTT